MAETIFKIGNKILKIGGKLLTAPHVEPTYKTRYEYTIFETNDGSGTSSATVTVDLTQYDEIGFRLAPSGYATKNANWVWLKCPWDATMSDKNLNFVGSDGTNFVLLENKLSWSTDVTMTTGWIYSSTTYNNILITDMSSDAQFKSTHDANWVPLISKIVGVKYQ